jgi:spore germination protein (amino acid permease)
VFKATDDKIGVIEYLSIILITFISKITDSTPSLYLKEGMTGGWLIPLISGTFMFLSLSIIMSLLKKYEGKGLIDLIYTLLGRFFGFILSIIILVTFLFFAFTNSRSYSSILTILFFPNTNIITLYFFLMLVSALIAMLGLKGIGRVGRILIPYFLMSIFSILILSRNEINIRFLYPIQGSGVKTLFTSGIFLSSTLAEIIFFMTFRPMIKTFKEFKLSTIIGFWVSVAIMMTYFAVYLMCFDYPPVTIINYPFQTLTRMIGISRFFTNIEAFFLLVWVMIAVIRYAMYLYTLAGIFAQIIKSTKVEPLIPAFAVITSMLGLIPENHIITVQVIRLYNVRVTSVLFLTFPILLLICDRVRRNKVYD